MSAAFAEMERIEARVLGAFLCVDAITGVPVDGLLSIAAGPARLQRNRSGCYVIRDWQAVPAFADYTAAFAAAPAQPALGSQSLSLQIADPAGRYLPRLAQLALPRDPDPAHAQNADSLFQPARIALFPSSSAATGANWSLLRVSLTEPASGDGLGGALLRVQANGHVLARGLTDWRGEALVPVAGVPVTTFSEDPHAVVVSQINVTLQAVFDPATGTRTAAAEVLAGRAPAALPQVDPDALEAAAGALPAVTLALAIAARQTRRVALQLVLP
ncbi:MAG: hypothetical protein NVS9B10_30930 [Nevskia sp.]